MKVILQTGMAGGHLSWKKGDVADLPRSDALLLMKRGLAVPYREKAVEKAVVAPPEVASAPVAETADVDVPEEAPAPKRRYRRKAKTED